jgi:hypothetical protein
MIRMKNKRSVGNRKEITPFPEIDKNPELFSFLFHLIPGISALRWGRIETRSQYASVSTREKRIPFLI